jgi:hypothetical protein
LFDSLPKKVQEALWFVDNPFDCDWSAHPNQLDLGPKAAGSLRALHDRLLMIGNHRFLISLLYAGLTRPMFQTTRDAYAAITQIPEQVASREILCLQRSLLAAKVSKSFVSHGVVFIGAIPGNGDMHAWIIEQGSQPDHLDRGWINYMPLLAICHH